MLIKKCVCDRCGIEFQEKDSKTILIKSASRARKSKNIFEGNYLFGFTKFIEKFFVKDYCPECIEKIEEFLKEKEGEEHENDTY